MITTNILTTGPRTDVQTEFGRRRAYSRHSEFGRESFRNETVVFLRQIFQIIGMVDQSEVTEIVLRKQRA